MTSDKRRLLLVTLIAVLMALTACAPEGNRERGGDSGGDVGNRSETVNLHGEDPGTERMYYQTPLMGRGIERDKGAEENTPES